jgi:hypothetical protein
VYLDGTPVLVNREVSINELITPDQVQAIEIFRGPSETPAQWRDSNSACGVILIWSRAGAGQTQR